MSSSRSRFSAFLRFLAYALFFAGIFGDFEIYGINALYIGLVLMFTRSMIINMVFGSAPRKKGIVTNQPAQMGNTDLYCSVCGELNDSNSKFCINCGTTFTNEAEIIYK